MATVHGAGSSRHTPYAVSHSVFRSANGTRSVPATQGAARERLLIHAMATITPRELEIPCKTTIPFPTRRNGRFSKESVCQRGVLRIAATAVVLAVWLGYPGNAKRRNSRVRRGFGCRGS